MTLYYTTLVTIKTLKGGVRDYMDFSNRSTQPQAVAPSAHPAPVASTNNSKKSKGDSGLLGRIAIVVVILAVVVLLIAVIYVLVTGSSNSNDQKKYVDTSKLQAVFLNTGQVYFGNITELNSSYFVLTNIYYLQTSSSSSSSSASSVSLVKLGCELHQPYDQMVINASQVTFWENLQSTGQVAKAVTAFQQANPNGQKCADQSSSSGSTSNTVQNAPASSSTTKP